MKNKLLITLLAALGMAASQNANATTFANVSFLGGSATGTINGRSYTTISTDQRWTRDKVYILDRITFIASGVTVTIEPGTLVRGEVYTVVGDTSDPTKPSDPGTLVVSNGGKLIANGTAEAPIIFTSIDDYTVPGGYDTVPPYENYGITTGTVAGVVTVNGQRTLMSGGTLVGSPNSAEYTFSGGTYASSRTYAGDTRFDKDSLWGGIMMCGRGRVAYGTYTGVLASSGLADPTGSASLTANGGQGRQYLEGLQAVGVGAMYGGLDDTDNSGLLRFVQNNYGGYLLAVAKEINGYSLGGVGSGTTIEFCESFNNADDDIECWGGKVSPRRCIGAFGGDDGFDTDQGYRGNVQFWVQLQNDMDSATLNSTTGRVAANIGDNMCEIDGPEPSTSDTGVITMLPFTFQTIANATLVGRGYGDRGVNNTGANNCGPLMKNTGALRLYNSVIMDAVGGGIAVQLAYNGGNFFLNDSNGLYGDEGISGAGTATTDGEKYSSFKGNMWYRCALLEVVGNTATNIRAGTWSNPTADGGADNAGHLFGGNGKYSTTTGVDVSSVLTAAGSGNQFNVDPGLTVPLTHRLSGLDLRSTSDAARTGGVTLPNRGGLVRADAAGTPVKFVGAMRNSNWAAGWTKLATFSMFTAGSTAIIPNVSVEASGTNPKVTFNTVNGVLYSVEKSTDNLQYTSIDVVTGNGSNAEVTDATATIGNPVFYRIVAL
ncbi:MAG: hypothetical protein ACEQSM_03955 [Aliarcobacter sp.]